MRCGLFIQTSRLLHVATEDWRSGHDAAPASLAPDQPKVGQPGQRLSDHAAGDAELSLQLLFRRQRRARSQGHIYYLAVQDVPDLGVQRAPAVPV